MFNDRYGLTKAVLEGRKTMTRRIATFEGIRNPMIANVMSEGPLFGRHCLTDGKEKVVAMSAYTLDETVAVAQSYKDVVDEDVRGHYIPRWSFIDDHCNEAGWNNKMFVRADLMPHHIRIINIKVERLQDITEEDCLKEGIVVDGNRLAIDDNIYVFDVYGKHKNRWYFPTPKEAFAALIDKVSGKGTWERNPWVFVYSFKLIDQ
jgi:hypothetical protein